MLKVPSEYTLAWYILRYSKDFNGTLSDGDCFRKIVYEENGANLWEFSQVKRQMMQMSESDIENLQNTLTVYGLL